MAKQRSSNPYIAQLEQKQESIRRKIAVEKRRLREELRVLHARRARVIGEAVLRLAEVGAIDEKWRRQLLASVIEHANDNDRAALAGTFFDIGPQPEPTLQPEQSFGILRKRIPSADDN